jgi:hypothetical protein
MAGLAMGIAALISENPTITRAITALQPIGSLFYRVNAVET